VVYRCRSRVRLVGTCIALLLGLSLPLRSETPSAPPELDRGILPARWTEANPDCSNAAAFRVHEYNPTFFILRQSGCTNFEKPFLYLLLGSREALLVDTGARGADVSQAVGELIQQRASKPLPLLVIHSHGHSDHTYGDPALRKRSNTRVIDGQVEALTEFFHMPKWPEDVAHYDLGDRLIDVVPIPGHQSASIAIYDRRTGILLTGDALYPGRLYVRDAKAFAASVDRLVEFTRTRQVAHVLGAHIENTRTPYVDYAEGTAFQPAEHSLELGRAHLLELQDALRQMGDAVQRRSLRDFTVWPVAP
jgi:hydroxyacylglutathione hydrolase